jgi:hypothetical protein
VSAAIEAEVFYCPVETRAARMYEDPEPAEYCENEVLVEGEPCKEHGGEDEPDWDAIRKDERLDR